MDYQQSLDWILGFQQFGSKLGLERMEWLMGRLEHPERRLRFVHVGGTNGKGSTTAMIASILQAQGYSVGMYTSPYLEVFTNRMAVNGLDISPEVLAKLATELRPMIEELGNNTELGWPTTFEVITVLAIMLYDHEQVDFVAWEVGLGGRLDATNIIPTPMAAVITNIGMDHMQILGDTLPMIASEKAGIIKPDGIVITADRQPEVLDVFHRKSQQEGAILWQLDQQFRVERVGHSIHGQVFNFAGPVLELKDLQISLLGAHQIDNAACALAAVCALKAQGVELTEAAIRGGLAKTKWAGRLEVMQTEPLVVLDGAHNMPGIVALRRAVEEFFPDRQRILVMGILGDKDYSAMLLHMAPLAKQVILTQPNYKRAQNIEELATVLKCHRYQPILQPDVVEAVAEATKMAQPDEMVVVCGSLYTISEARTYWKDKKQS